MEPACDILGVGNAMPVDSLTTIQHAHELLDQLGPAQIAAVARLLEVMVHEEDGDEELSDADRQAIQVGLDSLDARGAVSMEDVLADFGLTVADFEKMADASGEPTSKTSINSKASTHRSIASVSVLGALFTDTGAPMSLRSSGYGIGRTRAGEARVSACQQGS